MWTRKKMKIWMRIDIEADLHASNKHLDQKSFSHNKLSWVYAQKGDCHTWCKDAFETKQNWKENSTERHKLPQHYTCIHKTYYKYYKYLL